MQILKGDLVSNHHIISIPISDNCDGSKRKVSQTSQRKSMTHGFGAIQSVP